MKPITVVLAIACLLPAVLHAGVYRYVDKDGNVSYTDRPVDDNAQQLDIRSEASDPAEIRARQEMLLEERRQEAFRQEETAKAEAEAEEISRISRENCAKARRALNYALSATRVYEALPDGERRYLSDEEIVQRQDQARAEVAEYCVEN